MGPFIVSVEIEMTKDIKKERTLELARFTIQQSADLILFHDSEGVILKANDSACRHLGYSEDELIGLTIQDIDPDSNKKTWKQFWKELRREKNVSFEGRHQTRNGEIIPMEISVNFVEFDGKEYAVGFGRDISARKKMEAETVRSLYICCKTAGKTIPLNFYWALRRICVISVKNGYWGLSFE